MPAGRPPIFESVEAMQKAIDEYFATPGQKVTITGLAYHLGFCDRQSLYDYESREEFSCIVKKARLRVEMKYEEKLADNGCTGAIFALKNMGWKDKTEQEQYGKDGGPIQTENTLKVEVYDFSNGTQNK